VCRRCATGHDHNCWLGQALREFGTSTICSAKMAVGPSSSNHDCTCSAGVWHAMRHERWLYHGSVTCDNCLLCCHICSHIVTLRQLNTVAASLNDCPSAGKTYPAHWPKAARAPNPPTHRHTLLTVTALLMLMRSSEPGCVACEGSRPLGQGRAAQPRMAREVL
jgi:hypothetical protein